MLKQISIDDLCVDMYIAEILETPGIPMPKKKKGMIRDIRIISKFIEIGIQKVIIDTEKGLDIQDIPPANDSNSRPVFFDEVIEEQIAELRTHLSTNHHELPLEWGSAKEIFRTSARIVHASISALRGGENINIEYFNEAAKAISRSVLRNKDALTWLGKIRNKKNYLYEHSVNTATLMGIFAKAYGLPNNEVEQCIAGALLHDLGEANINEEFFERAGPLKPEEYAQIKEHVAIGESLLQDSPELSDISRKIVRQHHERVNGSGYPRGLEGDEISLYGRMFAIVDTYDAMINNRCYRNSVPSSIGMRTLLELSKTHFDEALVHQFIKCMGVYPTGSLVKLNNGYLAVVIAQNNSSPIKPLVKVIYNSKSKAYVEPKMLNLSKSTLDLKILRYENPSDHDIHVNNFMPEEIGF